MDDIIALRKSLEEFRDAAFAYFETVRETVGSQLPQRSGYDLTAGRHRSIDPGEYMEGTDLREQADTLRARGRMVMTALARSAQGSLLLGETDLRVIGTNSKMISAALQFRRYMETDLYVHHDEGTVLGVTPARQ